MRFRWSSAGLLVLTVAGFIVTTAMTTGTGPTTPQVQAERNGVGLTPLMGWSTWAFVGRDPTKAAVEAQARAMRTRGLLAAGYRYVNVDDFYYKCRRGAGPDVDRYGRWVVDPAKFPSSGGINGMKVVARYVHGLGEKFGIYLTPGISRQAVSRNTQIWGTRYTARQIASGRGERNYFCGGMEGIDYRRPGSRAFIDSWADQLADWGADYVKLDGVGTSDIDGVRAWSAALRRTGRPIHLELANNLDIALHATWARYSNGWRTGRDIACYCGRHFPLTRWSHIQARFDQVARWAPDGGPGGFNDLDSVEVGNGDHDGITAAERRSQLSLWALAASPLVLGADLTHLDVTDLGYLKNKSVIAVDQDATDARRIVDHGNEMAYAKTEGTGAVVIGLFNFSASKPTTAAVSLARAGISGPARATNLWTGGSLGTIRGSYRARLGPGDVLLIRAVPR